MFNNLGPGHVQYLDTLKIYQKSCYYLPNSAFLYSGVRGLIFCQSLHLIPFMLAIKGSCKTGHLHRLD